MQKFLDYAAKKYYEGRPIITDEEFDILCEEYGYTAVGHSSDQDTVEHPRRLYSLQKIYKGESEPPIIGEQIETPKLDGAAVDLIYVNGALTAILTRGDGIRGKDISHLIPAFPAPKLIPPYKSMIQQVIGEVVAPKEIPNSRNYASGALGLDDVNEFASRNVSFVAYGVAPYIGPLYHSDMRALTFAGFTTVLDEGLDVFPQDGIVFRFDSNSAFEMAGYTSQFPKGAYALKERKAGVVTTLLDIVWQVGKSGAVSPVGILEPVYVGDALVSRASLHNIKEIRRLNLELGCEVEVVRAGEIIPQVVRRV